MLCGTPLTPARWIVPVAITLTCSCPLVLEDAVWWPDMGCEIPTRRLVSTLAPGERDVISTIEVQSTARRIG